MTNQTLFKTDRVTYQNILNYPNIEIYTNEITFLSGISGSGKSTLLKLFNQTLSPDHGEIYYLNQPLDSLDSLELRQNVILVSQEVFLFDASIKENFIQFYAYRNLPVPEDEIIKEFLMLSMTPLPLDKMCSTLSGGERQRVYLAIYLSFMPRAILLDEPTSALDDDTSHSLFENLVPFIRKNNMSLIVVSHQQFLAAKYADRIINLNQVKNETHKNE